MGSAAIVGFIEINSSIDSIVNNAMPSVKLIGDIRYDVATIRRTDALLLLCTSDECTHRLAPKRKSYIEAFVAASAKYGPMISYAGEKELFETIDKNARAYIEFSDRSRELANQGKTAEASQLLLMGDAVKRYNAVAEATEADVQLNNRMGSEQGAHAIQLGHRMPVVAIIFMAITVLLCAVIGFALMRSIVPPLLAATRSLERVAAKDLTVLVEAQGKDEIGRLSTALNTTVFSMRDVLRSVSKGSETLSKAAEELSVRSSQTSTNTETQAGKTNQIATASQQMTATISEISQNAESATASSRASTEKASHGGTVMQAAAATMQRIATATSTVEEKMDSLAGRSAEIGKIVGVIQEISEQTNLLALNAAIEAARAGEQGRGFAVVAGEVRRLAERTKGATQEIAVTIRNIQDETRQTIEVMSRSSEAVHAGMTEVSSARGSLESVIESSKEVELQIQMIATAATEQASASNEISASAGEISNLATKNFQASKQDAQGCRDLSSLANELDNIIRQFKIDE
jgi:methyl-accepting chemotaxis protein